MSQPQQQQQLHPRQWQVITPFATRKKYEIAKTKNARPKTERQRKKESALSASLLPPRPLRLQPAPALQQKERWHKKRLLLRPSPQLAQLTMNSVNS
jgi:hypothetical protein